MATTASRIASVISRSSIDGMARFSHHRLSPIRFVAEVGQFALGAHN
jgi:hypothetical protein